MDEYQRYQLEWMISHGFSLQDLIDELTKLQYDDLEDSDRISTPVSELFDEWVADIGFDSEIWACENEWKECEGNGTTQEPENAKFTIWKDVCMKCKYCESDFKSKVCRNCAYKIAIDAIVKVEKCDRIGLSPNKVNKVLAERNYLASEIMRVEMQKLLSQSDNKS